MMRYSVVGEAGATVARSGVQSNVPMFSPSDWQPEQRVWTTASVAASTSMTSNSKSKTNGPYCACWPHWPRKSSFVATEDVAAAKSTPGYARAQPVSEM